LISFSGRSSIFTSVNLHYPCVIASGGANCPDFYSVFGWFWRNVLLERAPSSKAYQLFVHCHAWSASVGNTQVRVPSFNHFSDCLQLVRGLMMWFWLCIVKSEKRKNCWYLLLLIVWLKMGWSSSVLHSCATLLFLDLYTPVKITTPRKTLNSSSSTGFRELPYTKAPPWLVH